MCNFVLLKIISCPYTCENWQNIYHFKANFLLYATNRRKIVFKFSVILIPSLCQEHFSPSVMLACWEHCGSVCGFLCSLHTFGVTTVNSINGSVYLQPLLSKLFFVPPSMTVLTNSWKLVTMHITGKLLNRAFWWYFWFLKGTKDNQVMNATHISRVNVEVLP